MANKRKRDELSDSDPDEATPGKQILPVANLPYDFDQEPQDGMQYLFLVRRDARRLPRVTRAPNPYEVFETGVTHTFTPSSANDLPSEEWRSAFQTHFHNLRKNLTQITNGYHDHSGSKLRVIPEKKDRDAWWKFLTGHPESAWCSKNCSVQKKPAGSMRAFAHSAAAVFGVDVMGLSEQAEDRSLRFLDTPALDIPWNVSESGTVDLARSVEVAGAAPFAVEPLLKEVQGDRIEQLLPPQVTPSHLREIDHRMSMHLLMYFTHWINIHLQNFGDQSTAISVNHGQWIFALLTKVEDRLSADEMNLLRNLARACLELIKNHKSKTTKDSASVGEVSSLEDTTCISEASCWIVFAAVAGYWGQRDLWADAEAILARP